MNTPSEFGKYLKAKRMEAKLNQDELAASISKSGMYISNIEKGKNNSPPKRIDLEALAEKLGLQDKDRAEFFEMAAADRSTLPKEMIEYIYRCNELKNLIRYGLDHDIDNKRWKQITNNVFGRNW